MFAFARRRYQNEKVDANDAWIEPFVPKKDTALCFRPPQKAGIAHGRNDKSKPICMKNSSLAPGQTAETIEDASALRKVRHARPAAQTNHFKQ